MEGIKRGEEVYIERGEEGIYHSQLKPTISSARILSNRFILKVKQSTNSSLHHAHEFSNQVFGLLGSSNNVKLSVKTKC